MRLDSKKIIERNNTKRGRTKVALEFRGNIITYGELIDMAYRYADKISSIGFKSGDSISLDLANTPERIYIAMALDILHIKDDKNADKVFVTNINYDKDKYADKTVYAMSLKDVFTSNPDLYELLDKKYIKNANTDVPNSKKLDVLHRSEIYPTDSYIRDNTLYYDNDDDVSYILENGGTLSLEYIKDRRFLPISIAMHKPDAICLKADDLIYAFKALADSYKDENLKNLYYIYAYDRKLQIGERAYLEKLLSQLKVRKLYNKPKIRDNSKNAVGNLENLISSYVGESAIFAILRVDTKEVDTPYGKFFVCDITTRPGINIASETLSDITSKSGIDVSSKNFYSCIEYGLKDLDRDVADMYPNISKNIVYRVNNKNAEGLDGAYKYINHADIEPACDYIRYVEKPKVLRLKKDNNK